MKLRSFLSFCILLLLASCSQQKFAFRHTVDVKNNQTKADVVEQNHTVALLNAPNMSFPATVPSIPVKMELSHDGEMIRSFTSNKPITLLTDTLKKKYNFDIEVSTPTEDKNGSNDTFVGERNQYDRAAVTGFVLGILGWFLFITAIPGFIFSIKGLKSRKNRGLALAGLILSSFFTLILLIYIIAFLAFITGW
jgi:hypothetical protein